VKGPPPTGDFSQSADACQGLSRPPSDRVCALGRNGSEARG
jgi:hypothetical protein